MSCVQLATGSKGRCLTFWYHMFGAHVETLNLYVEQGSSRTLLWTRSNTQGNIWRKGQRTLVSTQPYKVSPVSCFVFGFLGPFVCGFCILGWFVCSGRAEVLCFSVMSGWWCWERKQTLISLATCEFGERTWSWHVVWDCLFSGLEITFCCFVGQMKDHCDPHCEAIVKGPLLHIV